MSSESKKPPSIPAWQKAKASPPEPDATTTSTTPASDTSSEPSLLEKAAKFLEDPSIKEAPRDKKVAFLETKGIPKEDIEKLLPESMDTQAQSTAPTSTSKPQAEAQQPAKKPQEVAPVVTYPEFLAQRQKPAPLVTMSGILTTAYASAGLAAGVYGLSKYIVEPMVASLTESRHEFATHTSEHLDKVTSTLEGMVSTVPSRKQVQSSETEKGADDASSTSSDEDPSELFHRDCAVQTSPSLSRRGSVASLTGGVGAEASKPVSETQAERLDTLKTHITDLKQTNENSATASNLAATQVKDLTTYLQDMAFQTPYYPGHLVSSSYGSTGNSNSSWKKDDAGEALRAEIRGVKGMLLSARKFPSGSKTSGSRYLTT
jgi:hypothetical protein